MVAADAATGGDFLLLFSYFATAVRACGHVLLTKERLEASNANMAGKADVQDAAVDLAFHLVERVGHPPTGDDEGAEEAAAALAPAHLPLRAAERLRQAFQQAPRRGVHRCTCALLRPVQLPKKVPEATDTLSDLPAPALVPARRLQRCQEFLRDPDDRSHAAQAQRLHAASILCRSPEMCVSIAINTGV